MKSISEEMRFRQRLCEYAYLQELEKRMGFPMRRIQVDYGIKED